MSITEKINDRRVWSESFVMVYDKQTVEDRYLSLILGLGEAGFVKQDLTSYSPLSKVTDLQLDGIFVRLYLVELNSDTVICYRVGLEGRMDNNDTETIFRLGLDTIWGDVRRLWVLSKL
jgi:hypothetical protein